MKIFEVGKIHIHVDFRRNNALLDIGYYYEWGKLWDIYIKFFRIGIYIYFQGDDLPF